MKRTTRKGILVTVLMLLALIALSLPGNAAGSASTDFCTDCARQCWTEANTGSNNSAWWACIDAGHSQAYCDNSVTLAYYNNCVSVVCNYGGGCDVPPKSYRLCKTGDCY